MFKNHIFVKYLKTIDYLQLLVIVDDKFWSKCTEVANDSQLAQFLHYLWQLKSYPQHFNKKVFLMLPILKPSQLLPKGYTLSWAAKTIAYYIYITCAVK